MRHYWFTLAVELKCIFVVIWLRTEFEVCELRNEERVLDTKVPSDSMEKMRVNFEPPGGAYFEKNVLEISNQGDLETFWDREKKNFQFLEVKIQSKVQTSQGPSHQQDLILRKLISDTLKMNSSADKRKLAGSLSQRKSEILKMKLPDEEAVKIFQNFISSICESESRFHM